MGLLKGQNAMENTSPQTSSAGLTTWFVKTRRAQNVQDHEKWDEGVVAPTLNVCDNAGEVRATVLVVYDDDKGPHVRRLTPMETERLQGFPDNWTASGADSVRYRQTGNAVAVPVVAAIFGNLVAAHAELFPET